MPKGGESRYAKCIQGPESESHEVMSTKDEEIEDLVKKQKEYLAIEAEERANNQQMLNAIAD